MKISKLFHWLYATLMFLPIIFFVPSCLYYGFNEHATNETTTEINYKYQSNEVNTLDDLVEGNIYQLDFFIIEGGFNDIEVTFLQVESVDYNALYDFTIDDGLFISDNNFLHVYYNDSNFDTYLYFTSANVEIDIHYDNTEDNITFNNVVFIYDNLIPLGLIRDFEVLPKYTDYNVIESVTTNVEQTIPQQINNAWNSVWDLPIFAWTHNSFVAAPFSYITSLFGVGSDNTLNYVFAYFVSISICWLVFDLIMYVPNLAHRWLDRSLLE